MGTSVTVRLIEGVRLIRCSLNTGFTVNSFLWFRINYSRNCECFDQSCVNRTETVHETLRLLFLLSPIVWNMCENLQYELVYFKELHNEQEYY